MIFIKDIMNKPPNFKKIESNLDYSFSNKECLLEALTHRSYLNEAKNEPINSNERMEFLGDSILSFWVSAQLFQKFPNLPEGKLTFIRTHLVRTETLAKLSADLYLGDFLLMSKGEENGNGRENPLLLANVFEAITGAIFLDGKMEAVSKFLNKQFSTLLENIENPEQYKDSKSLLQEKVQADGHSFPVYKLVSSEGPDHSKTFTMAVYVNDKLLSQGSSRSKQEAEEEAAKKALELWPKK